MFGRSSKNQSPNTPLNVLLTNGRFPVSLDLARQLYRAGHNVYTVDPMHYHVCKFSAAVKHSWRSPAPADDPAGYVKIVKEAVVKAKIDIIIPLHEEIFYLAECEDRQITSILFTAPFRDLYRLHNKWEYSRLLKSLDLDQPEAHLCANMSDVRKLDRDRDWAVKPILGRGSTGVHHLKAGRKDSELPEIDIDREKPHIAQEWLTGDRYCTYGVFREGKMQAFSLYPVMDTLDGSSSVYFEAVEHQGIKAYVDKLATSLNLTGRFAFDFVETGAPPSDIHRAPHGIKAFGRKYREPGGKRDEVEKQKPMSADHQDNGEPESKSTAHRLVSIECNPRATSGIHLWSRTPFLATAITDTSATILDTGSKPGNKRQVAAGMTMWDHEKAGPKQFIKHFGRLVGTKDVMWSYKDIMPCVMQPFLLMSYYEICKEKGGIALPEMFQSDVVWAPGTYGISKAEGLDGSVDREDEEEEEGDESEKK